MKKFISKVKKVTKDFFTNKSAFSLVELIVVIAIMAVMAAVLAPALLGYVERSRAQKDDSALSEVVNSVQLSLADQDVYDEMLKYSAEQYSCYVDSESPDNANKVDIKAGKYYMYSDNERQLDETVYRLDGVMRGVTITFAPDAAASNSATLDLIKGHVNKYLPSGKKTYGGLTGADASPKLADIPESELYNSLRATIGDKISISSQTYRNSEYTIFISMGTTGGQEAAAQDAIKVWGQFSGTNLPEGSSVAGNGTSNPGTSADSNEFQGSNSIPSLPAANDGKIEYGVNDPDLNIIVDFEGGPPVCSAYGLTYTGNSDSPSEFYIERTEFNPISEMIILETINGVPVSGLQTMPFFYMEEIIMSDLYIPKNITSIYGLFAECTGTCNVQIPCHISDADLDIWQSPTIIATKYHYDGCGH